MDRRNITFVLHPPRFARRGVAMYTPVACYIRVPAEGKRAEQVSTSDVTEIYHWTATIRNLRTFNITELDVDQDCFTLMDDELEENPIELLLYKFAHCVIPEDTPTGHYTMDFVLWYLRHGSSVMEPISAVSSRVFEVIAKDDAPLDALTEYERGIIAMFELETRFDLRHLGLEATSEPDGSAE